VNTKENIKTVTEGSPNLDPHMSDSFSNIKEPDFSDAKRNKRRVRRHITRDSTTIEDSYPISLIN
jgi:hypothetical protein